MFRDPLMADGSQICLMRASAPGGDEGEDASENDQSQGDPHSVHGNTPGRM